MTELEELRRQIDETDELLLEQFRRRMELARQIGICKAALGRAVLDAPREEQVLDRARKSAGEELAPYVERLFRQLMELSRAYQQSLPPEETRRGLVLIGMPGCGKTAIGREAANMAGRVFIDTDELVERSAGMSIPDIFAQMGEAAFREMEARAVLAASLEPGAVIAVGGGAVLRAANYAPLHRAGIICHIRRPLHLLAREGRPLSGGDEAMRAMYSRRLPLYESFRDAVIDNASTVREAAALAAGMLD